MAGEPVLAVEEIRRAFPALARVHEGRPVAYFDGPGGTQVPRTVVDAVRDYLVDHNANTHWDYPTSAETDAIIAEARAAVARFLGCDADEVAFGPNMTTLTFHLGRAIGRQLSPGDEVVVTDLDHHANIDPWRAMAEERGAVVRQVPFDPVRGTLDTCALERSIGPRTRVVAIGAASNALGTINDVRRAVELARAAGALVFVDAVHYAPHELVDLRRLDCDVLACSAYKFYGPHLGILAGRRAVLERLPVPKLAPAPDLPAAERFETGTQNHEGIAGTAAAVRFFESLAPALTGRAALERVFEVLGERGARLLARMWDGLGAIRGVRLYGPPPGEPRTPTVAFTVDGHSSAAVARALARRAVFVSHGDFYAATVVERLGLAPDGLVRAGCACYTTEEEVERLIDGVAAVASGRA
jgi:cysteine desulfurase family protein (TIGR01976 family)